MSIKHLSGRSFSEIFRDDENIPIWERREYWRSPLAILLVIGFIIYGISYAIWWVLKWVLFSWMRPFTNSTFLCKMGIHLYRLVNETSDYKFYICKACKKEHAVDQEYNGY